MIQAWEETTLPDRYMDVLLRAWTKYTTGGVKRTTALDCVRLYKSKLGTGESVIFRPIGQEHDIGR